MSTPSTIQFLLSTIALCRAQPPPLLAVSHGRLIASPAAQSYLQPLLSSRSAAAAALVQPVAGEFAHATQYERASERALVFTLDAGLGPEYETACAERVRQKAHALANAREEPAVHRAVAIAAGSGSFHLRTDPATERLFVSAAASEPFVLAIERLAALSPTSAAAPYGAERTMRQGPTVEGLNPNLDVAPPTTLAGSGSTGAGVTIAIADTGLWTGHCRYSSMGTGDVALRTCSIDSGAGSTCSCLEGSAAPGNRVSYIKFDCEPQAWCAQYATDWHAQYRDHGTHVASLALAAAPSARLVAMDLQSATTHGDDSIVPPPNMYDRLLSMPYNCENARVFSFSWAGSYDAKYSSMDRTFDHFAWNHPDAVILAAAGNEGASGPYTIGSPASAKNVIAVGALVASRLFYELAHGEPSNLLWTHYWKGTGRPLFEHPVTGGTAAGSGTVFDRQREIDNRARGAMHWSSRGPTADGRRKPEVSVPGSSLLGDHATGAAGSTHGSCSSAETSDSMQGTSMAAPLLAGAAATLLQLLDACAEPHGCELNRTHMAPVSAAARRGNLPASAVRAVFMAAAQPVDGLVDSMGYWSSTRHLRRLYRMTDSASLRSASASTGFGEVQIGRRLLPSPQSPSRKVYVYGERFASGFVPLASASSTAPQGADILLASQYWTGDTPGRSFCFHTTEPSARVVAALAWPEYPSLPSCNPCLQSDLALGIYTVGGHVGGAAADTANNAERAELILPEPGTLVKVMVYATQISPAVERQRFSLVVSGNLAVASECESCSLGSESVPCVSAQGVGEQDCAHNASADECSQYSACFAIDRDGAVMYGTVGAECAHARDCVPAMFPAADARSCTMYSCDASARSSVLSHGAGVHTCARGSVHECLNLTTGQTVVTARCVALSQRDSDSVRTVGESESSYWPVALGVLCAACLAVGVSSKKK